MKTLPIALVLLSGLAAAQEKANPFTGTTAAFEQRLRMLEERKLDAAIANEELAAEKANQERQRLKAGSAFGPLESLPSALLKPIPAKRAPQMDPVPAPIADMSPKARILRLVGTISTATGWVALIANGDRILNVREGETIEAVSVSAITRDTARVNGVSMTLGSVTARIAAPSGPGPLIPGSRSAMTSPTQPAPIDAIDLSASFSRK